MQSLFSIQKHFFGFYVIRVRHTAINRTNCCTLRFFVKTRAFGTFIRHNKIYFAADRFKFIVCVHYPAVRHGKCTRYTGSFGYCPFKTRFIYRVVWAFRLTSSAIDTFIGDNNCHNVLQNYNTCVFSSTEF